ncbi:hypothetical protein H2200_012458 [Cladophialophora chaetospira]|uniref:Cupin type-2 domain-containing protein n=1 Tax=Cladophialophora chaetospira TaxID=386627 RepID=A0AA38WXV3_9EURO|nr:hypothetical protein H2200_012458 [Cladophialophora chaetospira]
MLSFLRASTPRTTTAHLNPITYDGGRASQHFHNPSAKYLVTDVLPATTPKHGRSFMNPPLHFHMYQTEDFEVVSGLGRWFIDGEPILVKPGESVHIPMGAFHRFENASEDGEDLVTSFRLDEQNFEKEERFFRNFFGYIEDAYKAGQQPSLFQLWLFLNSVDAPVVLPGLGEKSNFLARQASWLFMFIGGVVIGGWVLGYKATYPEYFVSEKDKAKTS